MHDTDPNSNTGQGDDVAAVEQLRETRLRIDDELGRVIVGQREVIEQLLITILCRGHAMVVGVPGLAKTLIVNSLARVLSLQFKRIQFTPDLMPADITGTDIIQEDDNGKRQFVFVPGPLFANMILADEINRTPPKTQAALLEAMQEHSVTVGSQTHPLPEPFFVLATQNPIEQEGTYPLPEAQLDRFMFEIRIEYPSDAEELDIVKRTTSSYAASPSTVIDGPAIRRAQDLVRRIPVPDQTYQYALRLTRASRPSDPSAPSFIRNWLDWGAGPRAAQCLVLGAKARAALDGRKFAAVDDVRAVAAPVLRHRLLTNFNADSENIRPAAIIEKLLTEIQPG
jgi:MoxR-like ATPase